MMRYIQLGRDDLRAVACLKVLSHRIRHGTRGTARHGMPYGSARRRIRRERTSNDEKLYRVCVAMIL